MKNRISIVRKYYYKASLYILSFTFLALSGCKWKNQNSESEVIISDPITPDNNTITAKDTSMVLKDSVTSKGKAADTIKAVKQKTISVKQYQTICEYGVRPVDYSIIDIPEDKPIVKDTTVIKHKKPDPMEPMPAYGTYPDVNIKVDKNFQKPTE